MQVTPVTDIEIETIRAVLETPKGYWRKLRDWLNASPDTDMQRDIYLIRMLCRKKAYCPTDRQALKVLRLKDRAAAAGFSEQQSRTRRRATRNSTEERAAMPDTERNTNMQNDSQDYWRAFDFSTPEAIENKGFVGKVKIADWGKKDQPHPNSTPGIYLIVWDKLQLLQFDEIGTGSHYKGDPNVPIETLEENWIPESCVIYIGMTAAIRGLKKRLNDYMGFGADKPYRHRGGRYIWQLRERGELLVYWKELPSEDPRSVEKLLLQEFEKQYGRLPFANLRR